MFEIFFDVPGAISERAIEAYMNSIMIDIGAVARSEIIRLAKSKLNTTLRDYEMGVQPPRIEGDSIVIEVLGKVANMVEEGWSGGDLRASLKSNPKARLSKSGKLYAFIPFRHGSPKSSGRSGAPMTKSVHQVAKGLGPTMTIPFAKGTKWGEQTPSGLEPKLKEHHQTDIYAGMYRQEKTYSKATQSGYVTFRTISEDSAMGWQHPGIKQHNFLEQAAMHVDDVFQGVVDSKPIGFEGD